ncbi:MAG: nitrate reductase subunit alpha [Deltaproteobacteria bacterium RIFCSPLOWO2_12_FULL_40_28]|nr:MAG: nitrate reductase subunit alpha [Deltaproteobacteria bacterium RIFCSPHIGHO2_02_FULL_40_28]OGQ19426.1 MAG: nitrate reductase subunit alpha [Deltaproteobacteria bacterium RIFCSPHIGHO2_12_FULL_40_32]OGQ39870.1 MAG: nitrate reductase subunit alpha [Deltaproteobacteria bacterium RIFCSPLOWO2_02_FULL_40_36]OGQ53864.1 MAG: nitrate reductase subunit alpha [Deltaproteobacteria bacterium RIFCSPLOWO2_12_FULL_40_28]
MGWIKDIISPETRQWEEFYRNRFQHDRIVRSTHGVNCTGGCSWQIHVKDGIVVWETQQLDYPLLEDKLPPYEPRGCQRGISYSWYLYSPLRIKYPLIRGALIDAYRAEKEKTGDPLKAWEALQKDVAKRKTYQNARGKGGFRRVSWDEVLELMAAANIYTAKKYGPDRVIGFSPIPAMSMLSYAAGGRFLQLFGGVNLSFYDWYCDLPTAFPEIWGEQTDVCESADWYNSKMIADMGACLNMTRTPDCHFFAESRHNGTKAVVFSPDFSQVCKYADQWVPLHAGSDGAFWMAVSHVILKEFHHEKQTPYFLKYAKQYTDSPYLVVLNKEGDHYKPGRLLRANELTQYKDIENGEWKFVNIDGQSGNFVVPKGAMGHRWGAKQGQWNTKLENSTDDHPYDPFLTLLNHHDEVVVTEFTEFGLDKKTLRGVPVKHVPTLHGKVVVATVYDLIMAQYGVGRGLPGDYPKDYTEPDAAYTPAWQEIFTGVDSKTVLQFAREWANTANITEGKCMIIIGAGINHWYHANLMYRAGAMALMLSGCVGKNGGGLNHYVGQEKLAPVDSWGSIAFAKDWHAASRLQQAPLWHYINTCQYRYDGEYSRYNTVPKNDMTAKHTADTIVQSVRNGWMPFYPQFKQNTLELGKEAIANGAKNDEEITQYVFEKLKSKKGGSPKLEYSVADPEAEENHPRVWYIWRGNAITGSMKGHEYAFEHYLGTHSNLIAKDSLEHTKELKWHDIAPKGKMDLVVDLNFRMDSSALYSDIVLPAASWYEKADLNSTDLHSFIHPLSAAIAPVWESKTDWNIFKELAKATSEAAKKYLPDTQVDIVSSPLSHDTADEITQPSVKDWSKGECEPVLGKTMHKLAVVRRDYTKLYEKFISLGENVKTKGLGAHGNHYMCADEYDEMITSNHFPVEKLDGKIYPSLKEDESAANAILHLSTLTNGALTVRAYENMEKKTGLKLADLAEGSKDVRIRYADLQAQPRRYNTSPLWSGLMNNGRAYCAYTYNVDRLVPWRTLTGRQHFYLDHEMYIAYGENLPTYKPSPKPEVYGDLKETLKDGKSKVLNCLTPHGKWHIHSTYMENLRMLTLSRGCEPCWMSEKDAEDLGIKDNDWVEVYNDHGVYCTRACVSSRIPKGVCIVYHVPERTVGIPKSQVRGNKRAGGHNSFTRIHLKPNYLCGGYGQFSYHFNYWGPIAPNRDTHVTIKKMDKVVF